MSIHTYTHTSLTYTPLTRTLDPCRTKNITTQTHQPINNHNRTLTCSLSVLPQTPPSSHKHPRPPTHAPSSHTCASLFKSYRKPHLFPLYPPPNTYLPQRLNSIQRCDTQQRKALTHHHSSGLTQLQSAVFRVTPYHLAVCIKRVEDARQVIQVFSDAVGHEQFH